MKQVSIVIPNGHFSIVNVDASFQVFSWVNEYLTEHSQAPLFNIQLVGLASSHKHYYGYYTIHPDAVIEEVQQTDMIIIPAIHGNVDENVALNTDLIDWMITQYQQGAEIISMCVGSFFLAASGLLDGKQCSTHWQFANEFRQRFPKAHLNDANILTEASGIYTSGGAFAFTNLLIYMIEKYAGREVAVAAAKAFMVDIDRNSQSPFIIFSGQKNHKDDKVLQAQSYLESHFDGRISVDSLCEYVGVGRRTFERRFKEATANTIIEYLQRVRIEVAKRELEQSDKTVNEVMYEVGYNDTKAFRKVFKKYVHLTPGAYRNKYNHTILAQRFT